MPRQPRRPSTTHIYHIIQRGINRQQIFEADDDYKTYLGILEKAKKDYGVGFYGYCLMGNHTHLLVKTGEEGSLSRILKTVGAAYASWFNKKYGRDGHLFQDRYKSEPIEDDIYLLVVLRYIHQNPLKAGICARGENYPWSSYSAYFGKKGSLVETDFILSLFSDDDDRALELFREFMAERGDEAVMEFRADSAYKDVCALEQIEHLSGAQSVADVQRLAVTDRDRLIRQLKDGSVSLKRIARLTGVSIGVIRGL
jgi:REP element-mobilizing transposase RayT